MAVKYTDGSEGYYNVFHGIYQGNNFKGRIFAVMTILDKEIEDIIYIFSIVQIGGDIKKVGRLKIELGNIATDWTPAPEDLVPEIFEGSTPPTSGFKDGDIFIKTS